MPKGKELEWSTMHERKILGFVSFEGFHLFGQCAATDFLLKQMCKAAPALFAATPRFLVPRRCGVSASIAIAKTLLGDVHHLTYLF